MAKIPKLGQLDMSSMVNKFKSILEQVTGPEKIKPIEEALANEEDPKKIMILEFELLINQLHDIQILQANAISNLKKQYDILQKTIFSEHLKSEENIKKPEDIEQSSNK